MRFWVAEGKGRGGSEDGEGELEELALGSTGLRGSLLCDLQLPRLEVRAGGLGGWSMCCGLRGGGRWVEAQNGGGGGGYAALRFGQCKGDGEE
jgi:hypothetical protein